MLTCYNTEHSPPFLSAEPWQDQQRIASTANYTIDMLQLHIFHAATELVSGSSRWLSKSLLASNDSLNRCSLDSCVGAQLEQLYASWLRLLSLGPSDGVSPCCHLPLLNRVIDEIPCGPSRRLGISQVLCGNKRGMYDRHMMLYCFHVFLLFSWIPPCRNCFRIEFIS